MEKILSESDANVVALPHIRDGKWRPERSGDYGFDTALGRSTARQLVVTIRDQQNPALLGAVLGAMVAAGHFDGVEIGFSHELAAELLR